MGGGKSATQVIDDGRTETHGQLLDGTERNAPYGVSHHVTTLRQVSVLVFCVSVVVLVGLAVTWVLTNIAISISVPRTRGCSEELTQVAILMRVIANRVLMTGAIPCLAVSIISGIVALIVSGLPDGRRAAIPMLPSSTETDG